jgi:2-desacetyl-2-hydroxyethyl bacteriochlorophyllide A dehydrogenase
MQAARFYGGRDIRLERLPDPLPGPGEVLIRVRAAGICGSDLHGYRATPGCSAQPPRTPGHELAGEVLALGPGVTRHQVGQRVAVEPLVGCGQCAQCLSGDYHLCAALEHIGGARSGGFAELAVAPQEKAYPLPDHVSYEAGILVDGYACAVHALTRVAVRPGDRVAVLGTGAIGLGLAQMAALAGASVAVVGRREGPLAVARQVAGAVSINSALGDPLVAVREWSAGSGADVVFEAVGGSAETLDLALQMAAVGGTVGVLGSFVGLQQVNPWRGLRRELTLAWVWSYARRGARTEYQIALDLVASGRLQTEPLLTHRFPLECIGEAFAAADRKGESEAIKVVILP